jgi:hypothetical protein
MAKRSGSHVYDKQDRQINEFSREISLQKNRDWLSISESSIQEGRKKPVTVTSIAERFSHYNPNNPLNGSSSWKPADWKRFKETGKGPHQK